MIRFTHEAQVMPSTGKETVSMGVAGGGVMDSAAGVVMGLSVYSWGVFSLGVVNRANGRPARGQLPGALLPFAPVGRSTIVMRPPYIPIEQE